MKKLAAMVLLGMFPVRCLMAETFNLTPQASDGAVNATPGIDIVNATTGRVGLSGSSDYGRASIFVFALPKIPFGDTISGANLSLNLSSLTGVPTFNADLYSLGTSSSSAVLGTDYFSGAYGTDTHAVALQQHFLTPSTALGRVAANTTGSAALAADIGGQIGAGVSAGSYYFLRLNPDFPAPWNAFLGYNMSMTEDVAANQPVLTVTTAPSLQMGRVLIEYWNNISSGITVPSLLTDTSNFTLPPSAREYPTVMEIPQTLAAIPGGSTDANFGDRLRGYFYAPTTGNYTFAIASDDYSALLFSTDGNPAHATTIASVTGWCSYHQWNKYASQTSSVFALTAGQCCYIEAQHKQGSGTGSMSIGYMPPGTTSVALMPATNVVPYDAGTNFTTAASLQANISQAHPRLMLSEAALDRLYTAVNVAGSTQATWWAAIQTEANTILTESVIVPAAGTQFINYARTLQDRVYYLGLDYMLNSNATIKANCLTKIYAELQSAANWGGTNNNTAPGNWNKYSFLDIPELTHAYAIAYDWCYAGWTPTQKSFLLNTIVTNGFTPALASYAGHETYLTNQGNWTIVCDAGLTLGALAILGDETSSPQAPTILNELIPALFNSPPMAEWAPDGGWPEGECYWNFTTRYLSTLFASLETSSATCFNFDHFSGMSSVGSFGLYEDGPLNLTYNFSDESYDYFLVDQGVSRGLQYFGMKYNQPVYSWRQQQTIASNAPLYVWEQPADRQYPLTSEMPYPTDLIWYDPRGATASPASLNLPTSSYFQNSGIILLRSAWNNVNALFAGMKAGYNTNVTPYGSGHEHLELGGFVFDALGVRWAIDMGRENYGVPGYFDINPTDAANRWQYYRARPEGKNTLVINPSLDGGQSLTGTATVTNFKTTSTLQEAVIDMTSAYSSTTAGVATPVTSAKRGLRFVGGTAQLQDEVIATSSVNLNWFMHTATTIVLSNGNKTATLTPASGTARLQVQIQSPSTATFSVMSAVPLSTSPNPTGQDPNTGVSKLRVNIASTVSPVTLTVALCPYIQGSTPPTPPTVVPLSSW